MAITKNHSQTENKEAFEFVVGSLVIVVLGLIALFFLHGNFFASVALLSLGIFSGIIFSRHRFPMWSSFVTEKTLDDSKHPTLVQRFVSISYALLLLFALNLIGKYVSIRFETIIGFNEIIVSCCLGYFFVAFMAIQQDEQVDEQRL